MNNSDHRDPLAEARRPLVGWFAELLALAFVAGLVAGALYGSGSP